MPLLNLLIIWQHLPDPGESHIGPDTAAIVWLAGSGTRKGPLNQPLVEVTLSYPGRTLFDALDRVPDSSVLPQTRGILQR